MYFYLNGFILFHITSPRVGAGTDKVDMAGG